MTYDYQHGVYIYTYYYTQPFSTREEVVYNYNYGIMHDSLSFNGNVVTPAMHIKNR